MSKRSEKITIAIHLKLERLDLSVQLQQNTLPCIDLVAQKHDCCAYCTMHATGQSAASTCISSFAVEESTKYEWSMYTCEGNGNSIHCDYFKGCTKRSCGPFNS